MTFLVENRIGVQVRLRVSVRFHLKLMVTDSGTGSLVLRIMAWGSGFWYCIHYVLSPRCIYAGGSSHEKSIHLSICLSNVWIVTKQKKLMPHFYIVWKIDWPIFLTRRMFGGERPLLCKILAQSDPPPSKTLIFNRFSLVAPLPKYLGKKFSYH